MSTLIERSLSLEYGEAVISGTQSRDLNDIKNWLDNEDDAKKIISCFEENNISSFAILKNIYVPPKERGKGVGNNLIDIFFDETNEAQAYLLEVDKEEDNKINLIDWYNGYGFEEIENHNNIMIYIV